MSRAFLLVMLLISFLLIFVRMEFFIDLYEVALDFLELVHYRQVLLEAGDLCIRCAQTQLLTLNSNHAIEQRIQNEGHLQVLLCCRL